MAHLCLLAQSGGALVCTDHPEGDPPAGQLLQRQGTDRQNRAVRGRLQQDQAPFNWTATADSILEKLQRLSSQISGIAHL